MCVRPIHIKNPTKDFRVNDPIILDVPCGGCYECRKNKQNDMFVRVYSQMEYNRTHHINNYFATLTYHPYKRPYLSLQMEDGTIYHKPCFCKQDWYTFFDNLRKDLARKYKVGCKGSGIPSINYFIASEQGSKNGLPHYHVHLGVHDSVPKEYLHEKCLHFWQGEISYFDGTNCPDNQYLALYKDGDVIRDDLGIPLKDGFGLFFPQLVDGDPVPHDGRLEKPFQVAGDNEGCSFYVSKYSTKDTYFYDDAFLMSYLRFLHDSLKKCDNLYDNPYHDELLSLKSYFPFTCVSQHYGECIKDSLLTDDYKTTCENIIKGVQIGKRFFRVPPYITRKLFFDIRKICTDGTDFDKDFDKGKKYLLRYDLNSLGKFYKLYVFDKKISTTAQKLKNDFVFAISNGDEQLKKFSSFGHKLDWNFFAEYILCYRNRVIPSLSSSYLSEVSPIEFYFNYDSKHHFSSMSPQYNNLTFKKTFGKSIEYKNMSELKEILFNRLRIFKDFENLFNALQQFNLVRKAVTDKNKTIDKAVLDEYRNMHFGLINFN